MRDAVRMETARLFIAPGPPSHVSRAIRLPFNHSSASLLIARLMRTLRRYAARPVAGNESPAFKEAEARRVAAANRAAAGGKPKEESAAETMARLGLKTYQ